MVSFVTLEYIHAIGTRPAFGWRSTHTITLECGLLTLRSQPPGGVVSVAIVQVCGIATICNCECQPHVQPN